VTMKTWKSHPLYTQIQEFLERKGPMTDAELYDLVKGTHEGVGFGELNKTLMRMEIEGRIYVSTRSKGKRRVELVGQV
jgi:NOL1/NOP2/fmu family ribosome biogenesis protein